jgi:hypothetical protein
LRFAAVHLVFKILNSSDKASLVLVG